MMVLLGESGQSIVSPLHRTPRESSVRISRLSSCHSSASKIIFLACWMRASIGALSGILGGMLERPVSSLLL
jgi:hypothetical protein